MQKNVAANKNCAWTFVLDLIFDKYIGACEFWAIFELRFCDVIAHREGG